MIFIDYLILAVSWVITIIMLLMFVKRKDIRKAQVIFLFKQLLTWLIGLIIVQLGLIEYPVRLFNKATQTSFSFEYFIYPSICVVFNLHYPEGKSILKQGLHFFYFCTVMTLIEATIEKYTDLINYIHWSWYLTWITLFITFFLSRKYIVWFYKK